MLHRNAFVARERVKAVNMSQMKLCPSLTRAIARRRLGRSGLAILNSGRNHFLMPSTAKTAILNFFLLIFPANCLPISLDLARSPVKHYYFSHVGFHLTWV